MKRVALAVAILTALATPAWADYQAGVAAHSRGDYAIALQEIKPLAEQGNSDAQTFLGVMYAEGQGVPQDYAEAVRWYRKAAEQGHAAAQFNLGSMYYVGLGVPRDYAKAAKWHRKAAEQGHASAQFILSTMYLAGEGVPQDYVQAHMWLNLLVSRSPPGKSRDSVVETREMVAALMTPEQIAEAQRLAREWKEKHGKK